ncbi:hypothetical protein [Demequina sp. NBRC 110054]|uniref:hypothetical protein n=1 Tax=Demequina sp. NBRC 110054 TaxID=1570343 RepID=UPI0009FCB51E|nr:hypothetical protein [Demequina sp. NBRC 110054]
MDDARFWEVVGSTSRWKRGHLAHLTRSIEALGPEGAAEFWHDAVARAERLAEDFATDSHRSTIYAVLDYVLEGQAGVDALQTVDWAEAAYAPGRAIDLEDKLAAFYERETQTPFPHPAATAPDRIWAQSWYSMAGLPRDLVAGTTAAFEAVNASPEIVAALDETGRRNLEMLASISHDAERGWLVGTREGSWVRVRNRRWDVGASCQWDTEALRTMRYADGLGLVCEIVDTLAAKRAGFPTSVEVAGLRALVERAAEHEELPGLVEHPREPWELSHHEALDMMEDLTDELERRRHA